MDATSVASQSFAASAYAVQSAAEPRPRESGDQAGAVVDARDGGRRNPEVNFSREALRLAGAAQDAIAGRSAVTQTEQAANAAAVGNAPGESEAARLREARANSAQSIAQAISAYRETSAI